jgi:uncharacterized membrane protein YdjX (TVP38/TMEM64 family)
MKRSSALSSFRATFQKLGLVAPLTVLSMILPPLGGFLILGTLSTVAPWLREHEALGICFFVLVYAVLGAVALLPTYAASVLAGWAFGVVTGVLAGITAFLAAAILAYLCVRRFAGDGARDFIRENPKAEAIHQALVGGGIVKTAAIITLLRIPPNAPFATSNVVFAASGVSFLPFVIGTTLGLLPRTAAVAGIGASLSELDLTQSGGATYLLSGIGVTLVVLWIITALSKQALRRMQSQASVPPQPR